MSPRKIMCQPKKNLYSKCGFFSSLSSYALGTAAGYASVQGIKSYIAPQLTFKVSILIGAAGTIATAFACAAGACIGLAITAAWYKEYLLSTGLGLAGIGCGVLTATTLFTLANIWNPIGWGLVAIGAIVGVCSLIKEYFCSSTSSLETKEMGTIEDKITDLENQQHKVFNSTFVCFKQRSLRVISNQISALDYVKSQNTSKNTKLMKDYLDKNYPKWNSNWDKKTISLINEHIEPSVSRLRLQVADSNFSH